MRLIIATLALASLLASPAFAYTRQHHRNVSPAEFHVRHHPGRLLPLLVAPWRGRYPAGTTWHDRAPWGAPPRPTNTWARSQDGENYVPVDTYDVVLNGQIVGRDPDPNIRFQLLREAGFPAP
jgi:hypothetical protein